MEKNWYFPSVNLHLIVKVFLCVSENIKMYMYQMHAIREGMYKNKK